MSRTRRAKFLAVCFLVVFEVIVFLHATQTPHNRAMRGYLIKSGTSYHVAWRDQDLRLDLRTYPTLVEALNFANKELKLGNGPNPKWDDAVEFLDVRERAGTYVVLWKTFKYEFLNQMTFYRQADAQFFLSAFRRGHYSPSPMGHSIPLLPLSDD